MTKRDLNRDVQALEGLPALAPTEPKPLDAQSLEHALHMVDLIDESVTNLEQSLRALGMLVNDFTLLHAILGALGANTVELRCQMPALRQATKDAGEEA